MTAFDLYEIAPGIFHQDHRNRLFAMLFGYFDESGTDLTHPHVVIAGFVGPLDEWGAVMRDWNAELDRVGVKSFHRVECKGRNGAYQGWSANKAGEHIRRLSHIIASSSLRCVSASFVGDWSGLNLSPAVTGRFPHPYHVCFELVMANIAMEAQRFGFDNRVAVIFERQDQFSNRAQNIYDIFKFNKRWEEIVHFSYSDSETCPSLQTADTIAWEIRRYFWTDRNKRINEVDFPLIRRLIGREDYEDGDLGNFLNEESILETLNNPLPDLALPPGFKWA